MVSPAVTASPANCRQVQRFASSALISSKVPAPRHFCDEFLGLPLSQTILGSHIWVKPAEAPVRPLRVDEYQRRTGKPIEDADLVLSGQDGRLRDTE